MGIFETFTKRQKRLHGHTPDPYQYSQLPVKFRVQVVHIWKSTLGEGNDVSRKLWQEIHDIICREMGVFTLASSRDNGPRVNCYEFLLSASSEDALDLIDLSFKFIGIIDELRDYDRIVLDPAQKPEDAIIELNHLFKENGIGYQFEGNELIRIDSEYLHKEAVKPAINLLHEQGFQGAEEEFLKAHEHYRHGRHKESVAEALKAFESTLKTVCTLRKWSYKPKDTANKLIEIIISNELIPGYLSSHYTSLRNTLESGVPVIRNKTSGHGQGDQSVQLPEHFVSYALNLTASSIVFLVECHLNKK